MVLNSKKKPLEYVIRGTFFDGTKYNFVFLHQLINTIDWHKKAIKFLAIEQKQSASLNAKLEVLQLRYNQFLKTGK